jgi:hypothetical protein
MIYFYDACIFLGLLTFVSDLCLFAFTWCFLFLLFS